MREHKPADIIFQARAKAEKALLTCLHVELTRICGAFTYDTGLVVDSVTFKLINVTPIGGEKQSIISSVSIDHETP